ncbi:flavodoxin [Arthrobacter sp. HMWF013]|uniref:flavodoxin n=1 Tax=Arthrobacter sp. HMWF013 TaxID=2056849 RepID=UPI000D36F807|nr:flavodoxin [Arthrobacter sp. HMWF013]PTT65920.1 hypothetical protein DBR22_11580 [Arthrobacter sp. HMWF013]
MTKNQWTVGRRSVLAAMTGLGAAMVTAGISGCNVEDRTRPAQETPTSPSTQNIPAERENGRILLAYFSRAGENYYYGGRTNLEIGNTEVLAGMISALITCDVHRIEAADPYPEDYEETVTRNVREKSADARPAMVAPLPDIGQYSTVLLASGIWSSRAPMIMSTFAERYDFAGKTIHPVTTHAMSGLGTTERDYAASCPGAVIGQGLAVQGEEVRDAGADVESWLRGTGLLRS